MRIVVVIVLLAAVAGAREAAAQSQCPPIDVRYLYSEQFKERHPTTEVAYKEAVNFALDKVKERLVERIDQRWQAVLGRPFLAAPVGAGAAYGTAGRMMLKQAGDVVNAIKLADALAARDWKTTRETMGELELGILVAAFPAAAPFIIAGKGLNAGWQSFNQEIFDANTETLYRGFKSDPRLLEPAGVDAFIDQQLLPPDERTALGDAQRRRAYVYEYAAKIGVELGPATTWRQNRALLRSVVNRMRRDFQQRYETERQLDEVEHLRGELREQIQKLRASGLLDDLTRFDTTAQRCAMEIARDLVAAAPSRPPDSPPVSPPAAPPGRGYAVFVLTNASDGLYIGTEASLRGRPRCDFDGGGVGCRASDTITSRLLLGPYPTFDEARAAFCANITERHYFPLGVGLKGRWRGVEWYGLWHDSVSGPCLGATTATPPPAALPPPISGWGVFQLTNASDGLYLGTEDALRRRTRCSFGGGGINCSPRDVVAYRMLLGPFPTQSEARAALCRSVTERRVFPLGIGLKGRWQGGNTWYGLWDESVTADCGR